MRQLNHVLSLGLLGMLALACSRSDATPGPEATPMLKPIQESTIEVDTFYTDLEPYGDWVELPDYGWTFAPAVDDEWRPYTRGQWAYTDDGWYWDSDEDFGWATYHYGRWVNDRRYGWVWIPGDQWAPAWVSWRQGNGYTGWAPLPPRAVWRTSVGLQIGGLDLDVFIGARDYNFVEDRYFVDPGVYQRVQPWTLNLSIITGTTNVTHYDSVDNRVRNRSVGIVQIERAVGRNLPQRRTVDGDRRGAREGEGTGDVAVFRPRVKINPGRRPSRGSSLVKGEAPPPSLVERNQRRERARSAGGQRGDMSARDAARQKRGGQPPSAGKPETPAPPAAEPRPKAKPRPQPEPQGGNEQGQGRAQADADREKRQGKPPGQADKAPKQDPQEKKGPPSEKGNPKGPKPKPTRSPEI